MDIKMLAMKHIFKVTVTICHQEWKSSVKATSEQNMYERKLTCMKINEGNRQNSGICIPLVGPVLAVCIWSEKSVLLLAFSPKIDCIIGNPFT